MRVFVCGGSGGGVRRADKWELHSAWKDCLQ